MKDSLLFTHRKKPLIILIGLLVFLGVIFSSRFFADSKQQSASKPVISPHSSQNQTNDFSYNGQDGKDALSILKDHGPVEESSTGLVISINGKKADEDKREYWAFYINGKLASLGPKAYSTKSTDRITWKIEKY